MLKVFGLRYRRLTLREMTFAAAVASIYAALTLSTAEISFGAWQVRIAEALAMLPALTPCAIPGLFVGCLASNLVAGVSPLDPIIGSLATLAAACLTYRLRAKPFLAAIPPVVVNALAVGAIIAAEALNADDSIAYWVAAGWVGVGQLAACCGLGLPLYYALKLLPKGVFAIGG